MTTEEQRIATVEAQHLADDEKAVQRREANKLRKRKQRAEEREARDQITKHQVDKLAAEAASADAERIKKERIELIRQEFEQPIQPDEILEDGTSYWSWVIDEVDLCLAEFKHMNFEQMYNRLSICPEGRFLLSFYGVEPLPPPPPGWVYLLGKTIQLFKQGSRGPSIELWEKDNLSTAEMEARVREWEAPLTSPTAKYKQDGSQEWDFYNLRIADRAEEARKEIAKKKKAYADKIRVFEKQYIAGRAIQLIQNSKP